MITLQLIVVPFAVLGLLSIGWLIGASIENSRAQRRWQARLQQLPADHSTGTVHPLIPKLERRFEAQRLQARALLDENDRLKTVNHALVEQIALRGVSPAEIALQVAARPVTTQQVAAMTDQATEAARAQLRAAKVARFRLDGGVWELNPV